MFGELFQWKLKQSLRESCEDLNVCLWLLSSPQVLRGGNSIILAPGWGGGLAAWKNDLRSPNWLNQGRCPQPHGERTAPSCQPCSVHCFQGDLPYSAKLQPRLDTRRRELTSSNHALTMSRNLRDLSLLSMRSPICHPLHSWLLGEDRWDLPYSAKLQPRLDTRRRELTSSNHALTMSRNLRDLSLLSMRSPICHPLHSWLLGEEWLPLIPTTCNGAKGIPKGGDSGRSGYIQTNIRVAWDYQNRLTNHIMWFTLK